MEFLTPVAIMFLIIAPLLCAEADEKRSGKEIVPNKVKLVKHKLLESNKEYYHKSYIAEVIKVNSTYNRLALDFKIKKDFPMDVELVVEMLRSGLKISDRYKKIGVYRIPICSPEPSKYDAYLSGPVLKLKASGKCFQKGFHSRNPDSGYFRFDQLYSVQELKNSKFIMNRSIVSGRKVLSSERLDFVSNIH